MTKWNNKFANNLYFEIIIGEKAIILSF